MTEVPLTEEEFSRHLNTTFRLPLGEAGSVDLKLVEVVGYDAKQNEVEGMERFSLFFEGPAEPFLPQASYTMEHEGAGEQLIFIVPVARTPDGFRYQAVFNYHRQ